MLGCSEVNGKKQRVLPRDFQVHPFKPKAICINWLRYRPGAYPGARIDIPLKAFNEERCPAYKEGGWLLELVHKVRQAARGAYRSLSHVHSVRLLCGIRALMLAATRVRER
ncbi:hypothetical protein EON66_03445 [archaeon]|nr:MAG: hypothetical protein EON66_03445 [archaeon]